MCFDIAGDGVFTPKNDDESVQVHPGDIIFIPASTQYISKRTGRPTISHIGIHFLFEYNNVSINQNDYKMQTVNIGDYEEVCEKFEFVYNNFEGTDEEQYAAIGVFYEILSRVLTQLKRKRPKK